MNNALLGLISSLLATNPPVAVSNLIAQNTGLHVAVPNPNDPVEQEFRKLMAEDDAAQDEVDAWILEEQKQRAAGDDFGAITLRARMDQRFGQVRQSYENFIRDHPGHVGARLAYGSFLSDIAEEEAAGEQFKQAVQMNPNEPAAWNNLANYYGHNGSVTKAFECYGKALALRPREAVYYQNLATTMFLFRKDATNYFQISTEEVFAKSLALYRKALELAPKDFLLATDLAMTYYGIPIPKTEDATADRQAARQHYDAAIAAWRVALELARDLKERQGVHIHIARNQINAGDYDDAKVSLAMVTDPMFDTVKATLQKKLENREKEE